MSVAGVAHPVERHLAKVEVASSSLVTRSIKRTDSVWNRFFFILWWRWLDGNHIVFFAKGKNEPSLVTHVIMWKQMLMHLLLFRFLITLYGCDMIGKRNQVYPG